jgi:glucokinase
VILGVDLGGTSMRCAHVDGSGTVSNRREEPTADDVEGFVAFVRASVEPGVTRAVIGLPGRVDYGNGRLEYAPNLPQSWRPHLRADALAEAIGVPVALANDADLAAVGEAWFGSGRGFGDVAYVTVSTGIGAGVVCGGLLLHGRRSIAEIGHTIVDGAALAAGRPATVEDLGSGTALERLAADAGIRVDGRELVERVRAGDASAREVLDVVVLAVAVGVVNLVHLFTPEVVVVGGGLGLNGDLILDPVRQLLEARGPRELPAPIEVVNAALGDDPGLAGAGAWDRAFRPEAASA